MDRIFVIISLFLTVAANAQDTILTPNFVFKDGIYLTFKQVLSNSPIPKSKILTDIPKWDVDYYDKLLSQKSISILDSGQKITIPVDKIWGYCDNGKLYIRWQDDFAKVIAKGALGMFAATVKVTSYYSPYSYWYYDDPYYTTTQNTRELRQYIIDFHTGKVYPFSAQALLTLFKKYDPQLYQEYNKLSNRKKRKLIFVYLRKFNQKNKIIIRPQQNKQPNASKP